MEEMTWNFDVNFKVKMEASPLVLEVISNTIALMGENSGVSEELIRSLFVKGLKKIQDKVEEPPKDPDEVEIVEK